MVGRSHEAMDKLEEALDALEALTIRTENCWRIPYQKTQAVRLAMRIAPPQGITYNNVTAPHGGQCVCVGGSVTRTRQGVGGGGGGSPAAYVSR